MSDSSVIDTDVGFLSSRRHSITSLTTNFSEFRKKIRLDIPHTDDITCCEMKSFGECISSASGTFIPLFLKACCVKVLLELLSKRSFKHLR